MLIAKTGRLLWILLCLALAAAAQSFRYTKGSLKQARAGEAAVVLANGDVLLIGGEDNGTALASAELYDPASQSFTTTGSLAMARLEPQAQLLPDGNVLVMGGEPSGDNLTTEIFDSGKGSFSAGPSLTVALDGLVSAPLHDGRIFLAGVLESCGATPPAPCPAPIYIYDPKANTLTQAATLPVAITGETATTLNNGTVLLYGGFPAGAGTGPISQFFIFDPKTDAITSGTSGGIYKASAVRLNDGTVLICGGSDHGSDVGQLCEVYDPATQSVTQTTGAMEVSRLQPTMTLLRNGRVLVAGGGAGKLPDAEIYDPNVATFSSAGNFASEREDFTASLLSDGAVLLAGGDNGQLKGAALSSAELYQPAAVQPGFSIAAASSIVTVNTGNSAQFQITAQATGGFDSSVTLGCTGNSTLQCGFAPAMISPGSTSTLTVTGFNLSQGGLVKFNAVGTSGSATETAALAIALEPPVPAVAPASLSFGDAQFGQTTDAQSVSLANSGEGTLAITTINTSGDFHETNDCPATLADGAPGCTISVTFAPTASGARTGSLTIADNAPFSPQAVQLSGTGADPPTPEVTLAPTTLNFGQATVGVASSQQSVTLTNSGNAGLTLTSIVASGDFQQRNNCPSVLPAGKACDISIVFLPSTAGNRSGAVQITDNASGSPQAVALSGVGIAGAVAGAALLPTSLTFASQTLNTTSAAQAVILTSQGAATLVISQINVSGDFGQTNNCPGTMPSGQQCTIEVTATPTAVGSFTGTLSVSDNASGNPQTVPLQGTGVAATPVVIQAAPGGSASATVSAGSAATYDLQLSSGNGFSGSVALICTGAPAGATCTPNPSSVTVGVAPTPISVKVTTTAASSASVPAADFPFWPLMPLLLLPLAVAWPQRRRLITGAAIAALLVSFAACGGSPSTQAGASATPAGSYTLSLTAASGATTEGSAQLTLTVR